MPDRENPAPSAFPAVAPLRFPQFLQRARRQSPILDRSIEAVEDYRRRAVDLFAMRVVSRGLFLSVTMLMVLLYALDVITRQLPGINEITIPTMALSDEIDLGAAVHAAYLSTSGAVIGLVGLVTLTVSAVLTAKAMRQGLRHVFATAGRVRTVRATNLLIGLSLAATGVLLWLMTLANAVRTTVIRQAIGADELSSWAVAPGKLALIVAQCVLVAAIFVAAVRRHAAGASRGDVMVAGSAFAALTVAMNFVMLYSYIRALYEPRMAGGVVLVLSLLAWVNIVVRGFFVAACWVRVDTSAGADGPGR